jgi:hypothetical protein
MAVFFWKVAWCPLISNECGILFREERLEIGFFRNSSKVVNYFVVISVCFNRTSYTEAGMLFADIESVIWIEHGSSGFWFGCRRHRAFDRNQIIPNGLFWKKKFQLFLMSYKTQRTQEQGVMGEGGFV